MLNSWLVLLPPCIVLICASITQRLNISLLLGILTGSFIATDHSISKAASLTLTHFWHTVSDLDNIYLYLFLFLISVVIVLLDRTGGGTAFATSLTKRLHSKPMAESASLLLSLTLFIDDYLNGLTVGYVMRPVTDRFHIARAKLAFLVQALTSPLVILAPISSWGATIIVALEQAGISLNTGSNTKIIGDPFFVYAASIPYIFYSFIIIGSAWFIVHARISFGPMYTHEHIAATTGNLFGGKKPLEQKKENYSPHGSLADLLFPLGCLMVWVIVGSLWMGDYVLFGGTHALFDAFRSSNIFLVLCTSSAITLISSFLFALMRKKIMIQQIAPIIAEGYKLIIGAIIMLVLAATLGNLLKTDLQTGQYLAHLLKGSLNINLLPCIFFIVSTVTALITGSSWGTIMLLVPIAVPMLITFAQSPSPIPADHLIYLLPVLGAIFSGSVCGNHISPISDTTIMTAASSGSYPIDHAHTQLAYILPVTIACACAYLISGFLSSYSLTIRLFIPLIAGFILSFAFLYTMNFIARKKRHSA